MGTCVVQKAFLARCSSSGGLYSTLGNIIDNNRFMKPNSVIRTQNLAAANHKYANCDTYKHDTIPYPSINYEERSHAPRHRPSNETEMTEPHGVRV